MALFKSQIVTQASGSVGGVTFSRNRSGMYLRARAVPVNPATARQQVMRNATSQLSQMWVSTLTENQRIGWTNYAANIAFKNKLGDVHHLSGLPMFVRCNAPRLQLEDPVDTPVILDAPTVFTLGDPIEDAEITQDGQTPYGVTLSFEATGSATDQALIYVSRPQNESINYFRGPYQLQGRTEMDAGTFRLQPNPKWAAGQKIFVQVRITYSDGRLSAATRYSYVLTNTPV